MTTIAPPVYGRVADKCPFRGLPVRRRGLRGWPLAWWFAARTYLSQICIDTRFIGEQCFVYLLWTFFLFLFSDSESKC
jgi:hypothetical protein